MFRLVVPNDTNDLQQQQQQQRWIQIGSDITGDNRFDVQSSVPRTA